MAIRKNIGGDRLGSGAKMQVDLKTYNRSTHDLGYIWRSTMSAGTLVPFLKKVMLPGDTFDIDLDIDVKTHPTIGPLFGSYKVQVDIFTAPIRLYQSGLHNNATGIGMHMDRILLPQMNMYSPLPETDIEGLTTRDVEKIANEPSSLLAHLDILGGAIQTDETPTEIVRQFNAVPYLAYWDIYKNYYANKQEEIGMFINNEPIQTQAFVDIGPGTDPELPQYPSESSETIPLNEVLWLKVYFTKPVPESIINEIYIGVDMGGTVPFKLTIPVHFEQFEWTMEGGLTVLTASSPKTTSQTDNVVQYGFMQEIPQTINIDEFALENIDDIREDILATNKYSQFIIDHTSYQPFGDQLQMVESTNKTKSQYSQQGLALKTYQSDLFNNWMSTEWVDNATTGINAITAVDTSDGNFTIDALNLAQKVYDMLNRIAISGGTYDDWVETVYTHNYVNRTETPVYHGGLSRELVFQEVVSNSESETGQPLGTLAGKGVMSQKKKGGQVVIKADEHCYVMGIVSLTPRIDYSQGNEWDVNLKTMDDFHKPALDEIGFQDLITDQMAWWTTKVTAGINEYKSAGKQPAWINYMTSVNKVRGNFALVDNEMFMTLTRRYEYTGTDNEPNIKDLTTYIDPSKFNFIFADTDLTSQNFWVQIATDIKARRKMSAKIMPNL